MNRFIEHSQVTTTNNYNSHTGLYTLKTAVTITHKITYSLSVLTRHFLVTNLSLLTLNYNDVCLSDFNDGCLRLTESESESYSYVTTDGQLAGFLLLSDSCGFVGVGRSL
jgi:hypothetical protein